MGAKAQLQRKLSAEEVLGRIREFLSRCSQPVLVEPGHEPIPLREGRYEIKSHPSGCLLHVWGEEGNIARRIVWAGREDKGRLELRARRFGGPEGTLVLADRLRSGDRVYRASMRDHSREVFRRTLERLYPDWTISRLSSAADLEHSLSPLYSRGVIRQGQQSWAVIAAGPECGAASRDQILTFALIWLDYVRSGETTTTTRGVKIFLPASHTQRTAHRLLALNRRAFAFELYAMGRRGACSRVDEQDHGNLATSLLPCLPPPAPNEAVAEWLREIRSQPGVETVARPDGLLSLRVRGMPFGLAGRGVVSLGLDEQRPVGPGQAGEALRLARELARFRSADAEDKHNPLYRRRPETWLESQVRARISLIDSSLLSSPVYSQVPAVAGPDRGIIDLLACDHQGRLAILELKASEDPHLPLQALDYWIRVKWHLERGNLSSQGYFPGVEISPRPPRLILISPATDFHPTTETILQYFDPHIEIERVGVGAEWRAELKVVFRQRGARRLA